VRFSLTIVSFYGKGAIVFMALGAFLIGLSREIIRKSPFYFSPLLSIHRIKQLLTFDLHCGKKKWIFEISKMR
jgi:hypothetical protein